MSDSALAGVVTEDDVQAVTRLNGTYIECVVTADADRFATILAEDFVCSNPDGTLVDRDEFLRRTRSAPPLQSMAIDEVRIRVIDTMAIVHARTTYVLGDGQKGAGRYTDVWVRRDGAWLAVAAHVTRLTGSI